MLNEAKITCRALDEHYGPELCRLICSAIRVLKTRGITFAGDFTYETELEGSTGLPVVTCWRDTITDAWVRTAILTYVKGHCSWIKDAEKCQDAFESILSSMMNTTGYTTWQGGADNG